MSGRGGKGEVEQAVEMFHAYHVRQFVQSVTQAAENLHSALEQIKSSGLPVPETPTPASLGLSEGFTLPEAVPMANAFATPSVSHGTGAENLVTPIGCRSIVSSPRTAAAATVAHGGVLSMAALQMLLSAGTPPASPAGPSRVMDPGALGSALANLTHQGASGSDMGPSHGNGESSMSWGHSDGPPSAAQTAAAVVAACRAASEDHAGPSTPAVQPAPITQPLTPMSKRKRDIESLFSDSAKKPSPSLPPSGQRRKVRVVQGSPWPEKGGKVSLAQAAVWNSAQQYGASPDPQGRTSVLAAVAAAAAEAEMDTSLSTGERTTSYGDHCEDDNSLESRQLVMGTWTDDEKKELVRLVREMNPCGAAEWEALAESLTQAGRGGSSAERMYRTLTDPSYHKSNNPHGRRINPRKGSTPMHVMATYALQKLAENEGNLSEIGEIITANEQFAKELDWSPRPGTKTYPRWKDALVGCFKPGRYPHLVKTDKKTDGLTVYKLDKSLIKNPFSSPTGPETPTA